MAMTQWQLCRTPLGQGEISVLLCDDDLVFLQRMEEALTTRFAKLGIRLRTVGYTRPGDITPAELQSCRMAFLDIDFEREEHNGIDIARNLRRVNDHVLIFFVTNFIEYAPAGYEVQAFRYILKRELETVLERYILQAMEKLAEGQELLRLRDKELTIDLPLAQITCLEVMDHCVSIHSGNASYTLSATLSSLEAALEPHGFLRVHKSYLVNMAHIRKFRSRECVLTDDTALPVSEKNYAQQKKKYLLWKGQM